MIAPDKGPCLATGCHFIDPLNQARTAPMSFSTVMHQMLIAGCDIMCKDVRYRYLKISGAPLGPDQFS